VQDAPLLIDLGDDGRALEAPPLSGHHASLTAAQKSGNPFAEPAQPTRRSAKPKGEDDFMDRLLDF